MRGNRGLRSDPAAEVRHMGGRRHGLRWFGWALQRRETDDLYSGYEEDDLLLRLYALGGKVTRGERKESVDVVLVNFLGEWSLTHRRG